MSPYILGEARDELCGSNTLYDLYATANHYGTVYIGHYTAIIKTPMPNRNGAFYSVTRIIRILN